jgi:hypothetical protein
MRLSLGFVPEPIVGHRMVRDVRGQSEIVDPRAQCAFHLHSDLHSRRGVPGAAAGLQAAAKDGHFEIALRPRQTGSRA